MIAAEAQPMEEHFNDIFKHVEEFKGFLENKVNSIKEYKQTIMDDFEF